VTPGLFWLFSLTNFGDSESEFPYDLTTKLMNMNTACAPVNPNFATVFYRIPHSHQLTQVEETGPQPCDCRRLYACQYQHCVIDCDALVSSRANTSQCARCLGGSPTLYLLGLGLQTHSSSCTWAPQTPNCTIMASSPRIHLPLISTIVEDVSLLTNT
jgi:hypothetical protein